MKSYVMQVKSYATPHFKITVLYLLTGALWIYFSDLATTVLFSNPETRQVAQNVKGWAYVLLTSVLLFLLVRHYFGALTQANLEVADNWEQTLRAWMEVMDLRHHETRNHTERVTAMTMALARYYGIRDPRQLQDIKTGAILHDIGKIGIPDAILLKPGKLDAGELAVMRTHPEIAWSILSKHKYLARSLDIPYCHHERWDGSGYPSQLRGAAIPLAARLFAIIDVWDALSHKRVYKEAWTEADVLAHVGTEAGRHFDPALVKVFLEHYVSIRACGLAGQTD